MDYNRKNINNYFQKPNLKIEIDSISKKKTINLPPANPLIERQVIPIQKPKFGRNISIIELPNFKSDIEIEEEFKLNECENYKTLLQENIFDLYINSFKMLKKLVYTKEKPNEEGKVTIENIVNLNDYENTIKKKKKNNNIKEENYITENLIKNNGFDINETLIFESKFESGNLQLAYLTEQYDDEENNEKIDKYQLFLHNDTNTIGYTQWFFFKVKNMKKDKTINFSILNLLRPKTKYSNGIKIWIFSQKLHEEKKITWHHTKEEVKYYKNHLYRLHKGIRQYYYTLSFNYTSKYDNDEIFFANCIPYTYTDLNKDINYYIKYENNKYPFFHRKTLCQTLAGNEVHYITINNSNLNNYKEDSNKKYGIVLFARQHPSETVGSYKMKGAIKFLLGESYEAKFLRDHFIFKIIPMINVDGVICGNTRTSFAGCDLNRRWSHPDEFLHPEIYYSKELIMKFHMKNNIHCIVDFHGHFGAFNSFFYGNHKNDNFSYCKFFPFTCGKISNIINFEKSSFKMPKYKNGTGRINLFKEFDIENVVTLETSYFGCINGKYCNKYITVEKLEEIGRDICIGILYLFYHNKMKIGINVLNDYSYLKEKRESDIIKIENEFNEYIENINKKDDKNKKKNNDNDDDNISSNESDSESNPSGDNLDIEEIRKLLPQHNKKKKLKKKRSNAKRINLFSSMKKTTILRETSNDNNNNNNNINNKNATSINLGIALPKLSNNTNDNKINQRLFSGDKKEKITFRKFSQIPSYKIKNKNINQKQNNQKNGNIIEKIMVDSHTQTEDIFFKMHWSYFIGSFHIITAKNTNTNIFNKTSTVTDYIFQKYGSINKKRIKSYKNPLDNDLYKTNYDNSNNIENFSLFNLQKTFNNNQSKNSSINYTLKSLNNAFNIIRPLKLNDNITNDNNFNGKKVRQFNFNK